MIFLEIPFFRHYVFAVVQTSSSPTHPGGNPPLIKVRACARVRRKREGAQWIWWTGYRCPHRILNITTGTVALLLNHMPFHPSKQRPYKIFRAFRAFRGQKWVVGVSPRQVLSGISLFKRIPRLPGFSGALQNLGKSSTKIFQLICTMRKACYILLLPKQLGCFMFWQGMVAQSVEAPHF